MGSVLTCFFPTTVVLIDDDPAFSRFLEMGLDGTPFVCKTFGDPLEALSFINESSRDNGLDYSNLVRTDEESTVEYKSIWLNIGDLYTEVYLPSRFNKISVVISDYRMPSMNGVDFCSKISDKNIQRVLLTGLAEDRIAVEAFNAGYISRFSRKNLSLDLVDIVNKSARKYFQNYTDYVLRYASFGELEHLRDPVFADFFGRIYQQGGFVEYYMLDPFGSYLFVRSDGSMKVLNVLTEVELAKLVDVAVASREADEEVLNKLRSRKYMLVCHNRHGSLPPVSEWKDLLQPSGSLEGSQTYYYVISGSEVAEVDASKVVSFDLFKDNLLDDGAN